jgi:hypothetical protein
VSKFYSDGAMKRVLALTLTAPLALVGSQFAHKAAYLGAEPDDERRSHLLESTGHAYLSEVAKPTALIAVALCLAALAAHFVYARRGGRRARLGAAPFALVPLVAFLLQEHLERALHHGNFPFTLLLERPILLGLALQVPFALLAYALAWLLLRATEALARALGGAWPEASLGGAACVHAPTAVLLPRVRVRARGYTGRGPPLCV